VSGIVGIVNLDGRPVDRALLRRMTRYMAPRGPDAQEIWSEGHVGLGHAMLRTTWEAARERQPSTLDGATWIVADCRVDAREDLRRELLARGRDPGKDAPDAELILHAYAAWGGHCVDHLLGDFAFAIWDGTARALFCARDHLGVKAFFHARIGDTLMFSNTLNCLRLCPGVPNDLDEAAIADFLMLGYALDLDRTSFSAIRRLAPAHTLTVSGNGMSARRYWQMPFEAEIRYRRRSEYVEHFLELLDTAIRDRLRTDRVGVFMSGGLDSPTLAARAHRMLSATGMPFDLRAHTVVFDRNVPDEERKYSQLAADRIGIPIQHFPLDDYQFSPDQPGPDWYPPEPAAVWDRTRLIDLNRGPAAASRVLLRGDGADPLIDAMPPGALEARLTPGGVGRLLADVLWLAGARRQIPRVGFRTLLWRSLGRANPPSEGWYPRWFDPELERRLDLRARWRAEYDAVAPRAGFELATAYWARQFDQLEPGSMQLAAETRYPYIDLRLARYLLRLPPIPWFVEKSLLRVAMRGELPRQVLVRPKIGLAGNPFAYMVPPASTSWWDEYLRPGGDLARFVEVDSLKEILPGVVADAQTGNSRFDVDVLRLNLRPVGLSLWLRLTACANVRSW
jgi:asparagine synthase (glutamine-hydrolysing)